MVEKKTDPLDLNHLTKFDETEKYVISNDLLGEGCYGRVYKGWAKSDPDPNKIYAIKIIQKEAIQKFIYKSISAKDLDYEFKLMVKIDHENIVKYYAQEELKSNKNFVCQIMEYCADGNLKDFLNDSGGDLSEEIVLPILKDICKGFKCLYENRYIHRDIKPANILRNNGKWKICDFSFVRSMDPNKMETPQNMTKLGSPAYKCLQMLRPNPEPFSCKCDIWSVGIMMYELLFGFLPWDGSSRSEFVHNLETQFLIFPPDKPPPQKPKISPDLKELIRKMLQKEEKDRISWPDIFKDPLINIS